MKILITAFDIDTAIIKCEIDKLSSCHEISYFTCSVGSAIPAQGNLDHPSITFDYIIVIYSSYSDSSQFLAHSLVVNSFRSNNKHFLCYESFPKRHELKEIATMSEINLQQLRSIVCNGSTETTDDASSIGSDELFHSKEDLVSWAIAFMKTGLPENFHKAWLKAHHPDKYYRFEYQYIADEGGQIQKFEPTNDLYPFRCIEHLDEYLPPNKRNWETCHLVFDTEVSSLEYEYG